MKTVSGALSIVFARLLEAFVDYYVAVYSRPVRLAETFSGLCAIAA